MIRIIAWLLAALNAAALAVDIVKWEPNQALFNFIAMMVCVSVALRPRRS